MTMNHGMWVRSRAVIIFTELIARVNDGQFWARKMKEKYSRCEILHRGLSRVDGPVNDAGSLLLKNICVCFSSIFQTSLKENPTSLELIIHPRDNSVYWENSNLLPTSAAFAMLST